MGPWGLVLNTPVQLNKIPSSSPECLFTPLITGSMHLCILKPHSNSNLNHLNTRPTHEDWSLHIQHQNVVFRQSWRFMQKSTQRLHWRDERTRRAQSTSTREITPGIATELGISFERAEGALCSNAPIESWTQAESWTHTDILSLNWALSSTETQ